MGVGREECLMLTEQLALNMVTGNWVQKELNFEVDSVELKINWDTLRRLNPLLHSFTDAMPALVKQKGKLLWQKEEFAVNFEETYHDMLCQKKLFLFFLSIVFFLNLFFC